MKSPKILPWLARKAGVSEPRAKALWADAIRYATAKTGWVGTSDYWEVANQRFAELLEAESSSLCQPRLQPMVRLQARAARAPLIAFETVWLALMCKWSHDVRRASVSL